CAQPEAGLALLGEALVGDARVLAAQVRRQRQPGDLETAAGLGEDALVAARQVGHHRVAPCPEYEVALQLAVEAAQAQLRLRVPVAVPAGGIELDFALLAAA